MGKEVPKANDEAFGTEAAERNTYWCNLAMVRADRQGNGIAKAMFELAFKEVSYTGFRVFRRGTCAAAHTYNPLPGIEDWRDGGADYHEYPQRKSRSLYL